MENKYVKPHSLLRMFGALLAIVVFVSMFITKQVVHTEDAVVFYSFPGAFFGDDFCKGNVLGFIGYLFVLLGGLAGLAFVFIDEIIGKDLTKKLSFVAGAVAAVGALFIFLIAPIFIGINGYPDLTVDPAPIVFGVIGLAVGCLNIAAPILEGKGQ